ncbi:hypothetical protein KW538_18020 [Vibrio fluvialis]|nr:hypothetical protein [Vibrio fluvialis]
MSNNILKISKIWAYSSGLFLTQITWLSPVYLAFVLLFSLSIYVTMFNRRIKSDLVLILLCILSLVQCYQFFLADVPRAINLIVTYLSPIIICLTFRPEYFPSDFFKKYSIGYFSLFILDGVWRYYHPNVDIDIDIDKLNELGIGFQVYKFNSFMYLDSNFVGIQAVFTLSIYLWSCRFFNKRASGLILFLGVIAIGLTFSRSALFSLFICFFVYFSYGNIKRLLFCFILSIFLFVLIFSRIESILSSDISFLSKFEIIRLAYDYILKFDFISVLLGVGPGNAVNVLGIGAHNLIVSIVVETGIIGLVLFSLYMSYYILRLRWYSLLLIFPFLVSSMSLSTLAMPYFFTMLTVILLLAKYKRPILSLY